MPSLFMGETAEDDQPFEFRGDPCIMQFLEWLDTLRNNGALPLTVLTHTFCVYDSYPITQQLHQDKRQPEQVRNGGKVLHLVYDFIGATIRFIYSMSQNPPRI